MEVFIKSCLRNFKTIWSLRKTARALSSHSLTSFHGLPTSPIWTTLKLLIWMRASRRQRRPAMSRPKTKSWTCYRPPRPVSNLQQPLEASHFKLTIRIWPLIKLTPGFKRSLNWLNSRLVWTRYKESRRRTPRGLHSTRAWESPSQSRAKAWIKQTSQSIKTNVAVKRSNRRRLKTKTTSRCFSPRAWSSSSTNSTRFFRHSRNTQANARSRPRKTSSPSWMNQRQSTFRASSKACLAYPSTSNESSSAIAFRISWILRIRWWQVN